MKDKNRFISLIHNYCDKWCRRCSMTEHCAIYDGDQDRAVMSGEMSAEDAMKIVAENLAQGFALLRKWAEKNGIDPDAPISEEEIARSETERKEAESNEIVQAADDYMMKVKEWFEKSESLYKEKEEELNQKIRMGLPGCDPQTEADDLQDGTEIISWDHTLIRVKVWRAVMGKKEGWDDFVDDCQRDYDGSAKVALLSIERSIAAWMRMRNHFPEEEDVILDFLILLNSMRNSLHRQFPKAMEFIRPGFDGQHGI